MFEILPNFQIFNSAKPDYMVTWAVLIVNEQKIVIINIPWENRGKGSQMYIFLHKFRSHTFAIKVVFYKFIKLFF